MSQRRRVETPNNARGGHDQRRGAHTQQEAGDCDPQSCLKARRSARDRRLETGTVTRALQRWCLNTPHFTLSFPLHTHAQHCPAACLAALPPSITAPCSWLQPSLAAMPPRRHSRRPCPAPALDAPTERGSRLACPSLAHAVRRSHPGLQRRPLLRGQALRQRALQMARVRLLPPRQLLGKVLPRVGDVRNWLLRRPHRVGQLRGTAMGSTPSARTMQPRRAAQSLRRDMDPSVSPHVRRNATETHST